MNRHISSLQGGRSTRAINASPTVLVLMGILVVVHLLTWIGWEPAVEFLANLVFVPSSFLTLIEGKPAYQPLFTALSPLGHAFLHVDILHLVMNSAFLLAFGTPLERRLGVGRFLGLFVLGAVGGAAGVLLTHLVTGHEVIVLGASGAVSALFGAIVRTSQQRQFTIIAVFVALNVILGFTGLPSSSGMQNIAWDAHLGGFFTGYLLMPLFLGRRPA